jgi:uncharacterized low-complexity protein
MKKIIFGTMTLLALVAFSTNSYAGADHNSSAKCGQGKCSSDKPMKCGAGKCGGGK